MGSDEARVPRLIAGTDLTAQPLSPFEGFVLSRVDGEATVGTIADLVGLEHTELMELLARMIELGIVEWRVETVSLPRATGRLSSQAMPAEPSLRDEIISGRTTIRRGGGRIRLTKRRPSTSPRPEGVHTSSPSAERVEPTRRSVLRPRASHTGSIMPPGDIDDDDGQSLEELAAALGAVTEELSGSYPPVDDGEEAAEPVADPLAPTEPPPAAEAAPPIEEPAEAETAAADSVGEPADEEPAAEEPLDLDEARRKRIDDLYFALELLDHYQVLGMERVAVRKDIRHSYFTLSKVFHPDTMYGKRLGPYKSKMEAIFQRLTEAYEVLGKKKPRAEYDRYLELQDRTRAIEQAINPDHGSDERERLGLEAAKSEADVATGKAAAPRPAVEPLVPEPEPEPEPEPAPKREMSPEARARAKRLMAKKLRNAARASSGRRSRPARPSAPPPPPSTERIGKDRVLRGLAQSLRATASHTGGLDRVKRHVVAAKRAEKEGNLADAANSWRTALSLAPDRRDLKQEYDRVNAVLAGELASTYEEQAKYEQRHGKWAEAALSWAHVVEGRPDDPVPARRAAECLMEAKGDLHKAAELAKKAVELAPEHIGCMRTLAKVYIAAGLGLNAKRVLQRAAELDPDDEIVENLLRELG